MSAVTAQQLEDLCGFEFDESETARAEATIAFIVTAAEGIVGQTIDETSHPAAVAAVVASCVRHMQNQSGASTETIGGFTAQWANAGRIFSNEELAMLRSAKNLRVGTINLRVPEQAGEENEQ